MSDDDRRSDEIRRAMLESMIPDAQIEAVTEKDTMPDPPPNNNQT